MLYYPVEFLGMDVVAYDFVIPESRHVPESMEDIEDVFRIKPKAIVISNPNNPDGVYFPKGLLEQTIKRCEDDGVYVIIDEIQNFFPNEGVGELHYGRWIQSPNIIRVDSASKRYAIPEYKAGWVIADSRILGDRMNGIVGRMSGFMGNAPRAANTALIYLMEKEAERLEGGEDIFDGRWRELKEKKDYVLGRLRSMPNVRTIFPHDACINITAQVDYDETDIQLAEKLMKHGTLIMPASGYGYRPEDNVMRITFAERHERLEHSLDALEVVLGK